MKWEVGEEEIQTGNYGGKNKHREEGWNLRRKKIVRRSMCLLLIKTGVSCRGACVIDVHIFSLHVAHYIFFIVRGFVAVLYKKS